MFNLQNSWFVGSFLDVLVFSVACEKGLSVRCSMGVEDSYIEKGPFKVATPKTTRSNVEQIKGREHQSKRL